jgi:K+-transporting ATPase ATPase A chain
VQRLQNILPLNPRGFDAVPPDLAFNTSISFITNTNWQNYSGETTMSHLTQMLGLTVHNFLSAATGLAMAFALVRGFARSSATTVGNFWVDVTRITLYVLLPLSIVLALVCRFSACRRRLPARSKRRPWKAPSRSSRSARWPARKRSSSSAPTAAASSTPIRRIPFENPNAWTNVMQIWSLLLIPVASVLAFGRAVGDARQGRAILVTMGVFLCVGVAVVYWSETSGNPLLTALGVDPVGGNLEGKEIRFGQALSALFTVGTTGTGTGAVITMHDSLTPLGGLVPMFNILAGCIWPGGVGAGLYGFLVVAIIAVFVAGLMVGRTPEYLGKKIEVREMKLAMLAVLIYPLVVLGFSGAARAAADGARQPE